MNNNIKSILSDIKQHPLEYITMVLAVIGSILSSGSDDFMRGTGFAIWVLSNGYMLIGFIKAKNIPYSILFFLYELANINGVWNNWLRV